MVDRPSRQRTTYRSGGARVRSTAAWLTLLVAFASISAFVMPLGPAHPGTLASHPTPFSSLVPRDATTLLSSASASLSIGSGPADGGPVACVAVGGQSDRCSPVAAASPTPAVSNGFGWRQVPQRPSAQPEVTMAYDSTDGYVVLLGFAQGSFSNNPKVSQTWLFGGGNWSRTYPSSTPVACSGSMLSDDPPDHGAVFFGGYNCTSSGDTWIFHGGVWSNVSNPAHPPVRWGGSMTYDSGDGYVLLFGGANESPKRGGYYNDTWRFSGSTWTNLSSGSLTAPTPRETMVTSDDPMDGYVLLWGGFGATWYNDTWSFHAGSWSHVTAANGPPIQWSYQLDSRMVYDAADKYVVLLTTLNFSGPPAEGTWNYSAGVWTRLAPAVAPPERFTPGAAFDARDGYLVMFGGAGCCPAMNDTWEYRAGTWRSWDRPAPGARESASLTYDAADGYVLLFGGLSGGPTNGVYTPHNDTWKFVGGVWSEFPAGRAPEPRYGAGLAYDAVDGYAVLFGGFNATSGLAFGDTWEFLNGTWTSLTPALSPSYAVGTDLTYDAADGYIVLVGNTPTQTWAFHAGLWLNVTKPYFPRPGAPTNPITYDARDGYVVLFGTSLNVFPFYSNETWSFKNGNWTNRTAQVGGFAPIVYQAQLFFDPVSQEVVLFGGQDRSAIYSGDSPETWTYANNTWTKLHLSDSPPPRSLAPATYDAKDGFSFLFGGSNSTSNGFPQTFCPAAPAYFRPCGDTWSWVGGVGSAPYVISFSATPSTVDLNRSTNFSALIGGGTGTYTYAYLGLPNGCASQNRSTLPCTPSAPGRFDVTLQVTDTHGNSTSANVTLTVLRPVAITGFIASPTTVSVGQRTVLSVALSGGSPPFTYAYFGLPPGCSSQTVPALPCIPFTTGNYTIRVNVTDGSSNSATASTALPVTPAGSGSAPRVSSFLISPASIVLGNGTTINLTATGGGSFLSYNYSGLPAGCTSRNLSTFSCSPTAAGTFPIDGTATGSGGAATTVLSNLTVYPVGGGGGALILAFTASPTDIVLGQSTTLTIIVRANSSVHFAYSGLPPGCSSSDSASLACTPSAAGTFQVHAVVTDLAGDRVGVFGTVTVVPNTVGSPLISEFLAVPSNITLGAALYLVVGASGGVAPLSYSYNGLPAGCASANLATLQCTPTATGSFVVRVTVTDAASHVATASTPFRVVNPIGPPGQHTNSSTPLLALFGGLGAVAVGFAVGLAVTAVGLELYRRRRLREEGRDLIRRMTHEPAPPEESP